MRNTESRVGKEFTNNEGYKMTIIEYNSYKDCTIQFEDGKIYNTITYQHIKKGQVKTGGIKKGQKQHKTLLIDSFAETIVNGGMEKFQMELMKLSGKPFVDAYAAFFEYVKPKLARTELTGSEGGAITIKVIREDAGASGKA